MANGLAPYRSESGRPIAESLSTMPDAINDSEHAMNTIEQPLTTPRVGAEGPGSLANFSARRHAFRTQHVSASR